MDDNAHKLDKSFEIRRNHKKEAANVRVVEHLYRCLNWEIAQKSEDFIKTDSRTAEFHVGIPAGGEGTLTYTAHYTGSRMPGKDADQLEVSNVLAGRSSS